MARSEKEWEAHSDFVSQALDESKTTDEIFKNDLGIWLEDRLELQTHLILELWDAARTALREGNAIIAGGMAGAGKTTVLTGPAGVDRNEYLVLNPDDIKVAMAQRGMIPAVDGLSPMEASPLAHEEASELAKRLAAMAHEEQVNVIWDITMSSAKSVRGRIDWLEAASYSTVDGLFVDVPIAVGEARATKRYRDGQEAYDQGKGGYGGRFVPLDFIADSMPLRPKFTSRNQQVFSEVRDEFDSTAEYDNSGADPLLRRVTGTRWAQSA